MAIYTITKTLPQTYIDESNTVVQGYRIHYINEEFKESDFVDMATKSPEAANKAIMLEIEARRKLALLGK